ncbi:MAG TPA: ABC transporter substrate-binding protein [Thermomicrobiales bacterium]|nr:ABC transporter substrate-binding protein [Thermomicrobiales bacterium]
MVSHRNEGLEHRLLTHTVSRRRLLAAIPGGLLIAAGLAACGGDDDDGSPTATTAGQPSSTEAAASPSASDASPTSGSTGELRLIPLPPAELDAPAVPEPLPSSNPEALGVAEAVAAYDDFGTDAAPGVFPRTIRHAMGETTLETQPVRVVVLDSGELDSVVRLGLKPVGALEYDPDLLPDYLVEGLTEATTVGTLAEPDIEAIAALQPDLILSSMVRHEELYDTLAQIAPTVFGISTGVVWKQNFAQHARALGREVEASEAVLEYEERVRAMNAILPDPRPTVSVVRVLADNIRYYQLANYSGTILTDLGLPRPDSQNVDDFALLNQSLETLGEFADADFIFVSPALGENDAYAQEMLEGPLWNSLSAVQADNYMVVLDDVWMAGIGYRAAQTIMDEIESALAGSATVSAATTPAASDGEWSFTDDRGVTVTLPKRPERIIAQSTSAAILWDFGIRPVGVFGPSRLPDGTNDFQAGEIDFDSVEIVGDYGTLDLEKLVELDADLYVDLTFGGGSLWYLTEDEQAQVEAIMPTLGISMQGISVLESINRFEQLAAELGADLESPEVSAARTAFASAETDLMAAIAEKPGLSVVVVSPAVDTLYVANPDFMVDLHYFRDLGLDIVAPETEDFWELLSWEQANKYPADLILVDARNDQIVQEVEAVGTWQSLPAVKADQLGPWYAGAPYSYARLAPMMVELAGIIREADAELV